jgi:putative hydrolase of the HAD superfamily
MLQSFCSAPGNAASVLSCHDIGYPKEDLRFWSRLGEGEPFRKETTLFIDDSPSVLRTAREFGIHHIVAVRKPDSQSAPREVEGFSSINSFSEIMPVL